MRVHIVRRSLLELSRSKVEIVETVSYTNTHPIMQWVGTILPPIAFWPGSSTYKYINI